MAGRIAAWAVGILITALYAYMVIAGIGNIQGMRQNAELIDMAVSPLGWAVIVARLAVPIVIFAVALLVMRRSSAWTRILILATGFCVAAVMLLTITDLQVRVIPALDFFV